MTKASKVLTVALLFFSIAFFGAAGLNKIVESDWKKLAESYTSKIDEQKKQNAAALKRIGEVEPKIVEVTEAKAADLKAIAAAVADLKAQLQKRQDELATLSTQLVELTKQTTQTRQTAIDRRAEVDQLASQLGELRSQKEQVLAESKRLTDLLYQAQGTLDRVSTRKQLLEADGAKLPAAPATKS